MLAPGVTMFSDRCLACFRSVFGYVFTTGACVLVAVYSPAVAPSSAVAASLHDDGNPVAISRLAAPVDIVIAVDESQSIKKQDLDLEETAAGLITQGEFSPESKIGVLGFGGPNDHYNAQTNRQKPVDPVCPMTEVNTFASVQSLSKCITKLHSRTPREGNRTDFIDAIQDGVRDLIGTRDTGRPLLLFLLTDGKIDLVGSPNFPGPNETVINDSANQYLLTTTIPQARAAGVQIWPLGFGPSVDGMELQSMATGGAQGSCNAAADVVPRATTVASVSDIEQALLQIFASTRCLRYSEYKGAPVGDGTQTDLSVTVPPMVTVGLIEVTRHFRQISVAFSGPDNQPVSAAEGSRTGQSFSLVGTSGPVESLWIGNPRPGRWQVHVTAGAGVPAGSLVTVSMLWQKVLHADIVTDPTNPVPGQAMTATVKLQFGRTALTTAERAGIQVSVKVTGPGLTKPVFVPVNDKGIPPDPVAGDGVYNGTFTVPRSASGTLTAEGMVSAQGVVGDTDSVRIPVSTSALTVTGRMILPAGRVPQGGQVTGTLDLRNLTGQPHQIRLVPVDTPPGVTVTPPTISLPAASGTTSYHFTVQFARSVPLGLVTGHLNAVEVATGSLYAQAAIASTVVAPQPGIRHPWWFWALAVGALGLIACTPIVWAWILWLSRRGNRRRARRTASALS
jgi:hypothetical protein